MFFWSNCNETSQELSLGCAELHSRLAIFKIFIELRTNILKMSSQVDNGHSVAVFV
jgi:hypothetical protein